MYAFSDLNMIAKKAKIEERARLLWAFSIENFFPVTKFDAISIPSIHWHHTRIFIDATLLLPQKVENCAIYFSNLFIMLLNSIINILNLFHSETIPRLS